MSLPVKTLFLIPTFFLYFLSGISAQTLFTVDHSTVSKEEFLKAYKNAIAAYQEVEVFEGRISVDRAKQSFLEESPMNEKGGFLWSCNFMITAKFFKKLEKSKIA